MPVDFRPTEAEFVSQAFDEAQSFKANELGTVATFRDVGSTDYGSADFKYVVFDGPETPVAGWACYYKAAGISTSTVTVDVDDADTIAIGAGILHCVPTDGQYLWIQITGYAVLAIAIASGAAGKPVTADLHTVDGSLKISANVAETRVGTCADATTGLLCAFPH